MIRITDKELSSMTLEDLRSLNKKVKLAEKNFRLSANKEVASSLKAGDKVEYTLPKTSKIETGTVTKVKRVMIAIKNGTTLVNVPLMNVKKLSSSSPVVKAVKANVAKKKASKPAITPPTTAPTVSKAKITKPKATSTVIKVPVVAASLDVSSLSSNNDA